MAKAYGGRFTALFVQTPEFEKSAREEKSALSDNINLAVRLGARVVTLYENDISYRISEYSKLAGVTKVVAGESIHKKVFFNTKNHLTHQLARLLMPGQLYIIPFDIKGKNSGIAKKRKKDIYLLSPKDALKALLIVAAATAIGVLFKYLGISESNIILVYILAVLMASFVTDGYMCGVVVSLASVLAFDFLFTRPVFTFHVSGDSYPITFGIMLTVSLVISTLAARLKNNAKKSARSSYGTKLLFDTNRLLMKSTDESEILAIGAKQIMQLVSADVAAYPRKDNVIEKPLTFQVNPAAKNMFLFIAEERAAKHAFATQNTCGHGTDEMGDLKGLYIPVKTDRGIYGVIGIMAAETDYFVDNIVMSIVRECALAVENVRNAKEKQIAAEKIKNEQLRSGLLRTISHDLRTPLTAISGNRENLLANSHGMSYNDIQQAYKDIYDDSRWLTGVVENILSVTRMSEDKMRINMTEELVEDVVAEAVHMMERKKNGHNIITDFSGDLLVSKMDRRLIMQVVVNLVENRIKYTPQGSDIIISTDKKGDMATVTVADKGPGIADKDKEHIFEIFYTRNKNSRDSRRSIGLGLSLCKSIVQAHGGEIYVQDNIPNGSVFCFTLPAQEVNLNG